MIYSFLLAVALVFSGLTFLNTKRSFEATVQHYVHNIKTLHKQSDIIPGFKITGKWELPSELKEVSGIAFIDENRFACIQDELGTIFIYNILSDEIEKKIQFAKPGDYEDITLIGSTAYVVRSDGKLFEVDLSDKKTPVKEYKTPLTVKNDIEGLCFDRNNNRLLLTTKEEVSGNKNYKGIYSFDLTKKTLLPEPVYKIDLTHKVFTSGAKRNKIIKPSAIAIHPATGEIFITDGPNSRLLIMNSSGKIVKLLVLGSDFEQPEGITFSPDGELFISNEGNKKPANILKLELDNL
jgi:uncharacterized protein YjiK